MTEPAPKKDPRILLFDLETAPNIGATWGKWDQNVVWFLEPWHILAVGWRWLGDPKSQVIGLDNFAPGPYHSEDDLPLVGYLHELFDEADVVVAHNGDKFDIPKARARMIVHGMDPPSPVQTVDTLKLCRKEFSFTSNSLGDVCDMLGLGRKMETGGYRLWQDCMAGDQEAWKTMKRYCASDVDLLEALYRRLRPWAQRHPNMATIANRPNTCPTCFSEGTMVVRGYRPTALMIKQVFQCTACGKYMSARRAEKSAAEYVN